MTELTPDEKAELRKAAEAATPGPWVQPIDDEPRLISADGSESLLGLTKDNEAIVWIEEDANFIARANPATVIALLDENARLSEEVARLTAERQWIRCDERMPEMGERVVVRYFYGRAIGEFTSGGFHDADGALRDVTHWVRLPEPPR